MATAATPRDAHEEQRPKGKGGGTWRNGKGGPNKKIRIQSSEIPGCENVLVSRASPANNKGPRRKRSATEGERQSYHNYRLTGMEALEATQRHCQHLAKRSRKNRKLVELQCVLRLFVYGFSPWLTYSRVHLSLKRSLDRRTTVEHPS